MFVIRLPGGRLRVPQGMVTDEVFGDGYVEIGPEDPDYARLLPESLTEEEYEAKRAAWREGDAALQVMFEEWKAQQQ